MLYPQEYGSRYWVVRVPPTIAPTGFIRIYADELTVSDGNVLIFSRYLHGDPEQKEVLLAIRETNWSTVYQASPEDGKPLGVEQWKGVL